MHGVRSMKLASDSQQQASGPTARTVSFSLAGNCDRPHHAAVWAEPNPSFLSATCPTTHNRFPANETKKDKMQRTKHDPELALAHENNANAAVHPHAGIRKDSKKLPYASMPTSERIEIGSSDACGIVPMVSAPEMQAVSTARLFCRSRATSATLGANGQFRKNTGPPAEARAKPVAPDKIRHAHRNNPSKGGSGKKRPRPLKHAQSLLPR